MVCFLRPQKKWPEFCHLRSQSRSKRRSTLNIGWAGLAGLGVQSHDKLHPLCMNTYHDISESDKMIQNREMLAAPDQVTHFKFQLLSRRA